MRFLQPVLIAAILCAALTLYLVGPFLLAILFGLSEGWGLLTMIAWWCFWPILIVVAMELE